MTTCRNSVDGFLLRWPVAAWSLAGTVLIACTWPLWWRVSVPRGFPNVPLFGSFDWPWLELALAVGMLLGLAVGFVGAIMNSRRWIATAGLVFVICGLGSVLFDLHRLQPWMGHFLIVGAVVASRGAKSQRGLLEGHAVDHARAAERPLSNVPARSLLSSHTGLLILLTSSIYVWSGWSKLDYSFANSYGQIFVETLLEPIGILTHLWSAWLKQAAALCLPVGECLAGALLLFRRTRTAGFVLSFVMHAALLVIVGPFGLRHESGVVIWNVFFIVQNALLWRADRTDEWAISPTTFAKIVVMLASVLPVLRGVGCLDNWPAWAVYAANSSRVFVLVERSSIDADFPSESLEPRQVNDGFEYFRIDRWSIARCHAPTYPQDRFQIAICLWLYDRYPNLKMQVVWESAAHRLTGERSSQSFHSRIELQGFADRFWWGTTAIRD